MAESEEAREPGPGSKSKRFVINVLWSWTGVAVNLAVALLLNPYVIRKLGEVRYGIWALIFSILEYFGFFDLGLNTAVTNFCARYEAAGEPEKINEVINTAVFYFSAIAVVAVALTLGLSHNAQKLFRVPAEYQSEFAILIQITGLSWALCMVLNMFVSALDGFQRFDLESRVWVGTILLRSTGYFLVLKLGHGLVEMAAIFVVFQLVGYALNFRNFRIVFRPLRFSWSLVKFSVFRQIVSYGLKSFVANTSTMVLNQSGTVLIGHYQPTQFAGFYALPSKILQYAVDAVSRLAIVTRSSAAELSELGKRQAVLKLGIYSNRYSLTLFMPLVVLLLVYGRELILRWVGPSFAEHSAPLLPVFVVSTALVLAGQFNSSALLYGLSLHGGYARALVLEALLNVTGMVLVIPRYGILGAAVVSSTLMLLVRGLYTPWLVCQNLEVGFLAYLGRIYVRPIVTSMPVFALAWLLKTHGLPGRTWLELVAVALLIGMVYGGLALFTCIEREHRGLLLSHIPIVGARLAAVSA
ncbi:MAG TPA: oligosaccharide flippase family protein [Bryobacteraceae bacterium]|nr:oligosaccharide flippase family protein [Bryobacteraceae bacterium]